MPRMRQSSGVLRRNSWLWWVFFSMTLKVAEGDPQRPGLFGSSESWYVPAVFAL